MMLHTTSDAWELFLKTYPKKIKGIFCKTYRKSTYNHNHKSQSLKIKSANCKMPM